MKTSLRKAHASLSKAMLLLIPVILLAAFWARQNPAELKPPVLITPPQSETGETGS